MRRSTWVAVLVTAGVLALAGALPRLLPLLGTHAAPPFPATAASTAPAASRATGTPGALVRGAATLRASLEARAVLGTLLLRTGAYGPPPPAPGWRDPLPGLPALLALVLVPLPFVALGWRRRRRGFLARRTRALRLARDGRAAAGIARECRLPQDTVRALLRPANAGRPPR